MPNVDTVPIVPNDLVDFFDTKQEGGGPDKTAIVAVAGEDMATGLLKQYFESEEATSTVTVLPQKRRSSTRTMPKTARRPKAVNKSRSTLDCWLLVEKQSGRKILYQVEIKNWSAHSRGGKELLRSAAPDDIAAKKNWDELVWDSEKQQLKVSHGRTDSTGRPAFEKVLWRMDVPQEHEDTTIAPLLCMWETTHPTGKIEPLFWVPLTETYIKKMWEKAGDPEDHVPFTRLYVFSISAYLRTLSNIPFVEIEMPNTIRRLRLLNRLFRHNTRSNSDRDFP